MRLLSIILFIAITILHLQCGRKQYPVDLAEPSMPFTKDTIAYRVFDSLENYLAANLKDKNGNPAIGILIDPKCTYCPEIKKYHYEWRNLMGMNILYRHNDKGCEEYMSALKNTTRRLHIKDTMLPVLFIAIDGVLTKKYQKKHFSYDSAHIPCYNFRDALIVNIPAMTFFKQNDTSFLHWQK